MKYAVTDIGSNTIRLTIYDLVDGRPRVLMKKKSQVGLADYIKGNKMTQQGVWRLVHVLKTYEPIYKLFQAEAIFTFATAAIRNVKNSKEVLKTLEEATGLNVDLISGPMEAELGYLGVHSSFTLDAGVHVDIGGGSTEILIHKKDKILYKNSLDEGSLSLYRQFVSRIFPNKKESKEIKKYIRGKLEDLDLPKVKSSLPIVGVGGTIRACNNLCSELFEPVDYQFSSDGEDLPGRFSLAQSKSISQGLMTFDPVYVRNVLRVCPSRIHTLTPGILILQEVAKGFSCQEIMVSNCGIREGYLIWRLDQDHGKE